MQAVRSDRITRICSALLAFVLLLSLLITAANLRALAPAWQPGVTYAVGQLASYNGVDYRCLQGHTAQAGWEPPSTPALWEPQQGGVTPVPPTNTSTATRTRTGTTVSNPPTATRTRTRTSTTTTGINVKVNFQPAGTPTYSGYLVDSGAVYGTRGNGQTYGWNVDNATWSRDRNASTSQDQRYDTLNHMQKGGGSVWEIALPNGSYSVRIVAGDPNNNDSVYNITAEGVTVVSGTPTTSVRWYDGNKIVTVADGRLTIANGAGSSNNKINFIDIASTTVTPPTATSTRTRTSTTGTNPPTTTRTSTTAPSATRTVPPTTTPTSGPITSGNKIIGYFAEWGVYGRQYFVKNIHTSGSASKLTHILYAFGNTTGGRCAIGDAYADYDMAYTAEQSVDGVADTWDAGALRGSFNQLRKLKKMYPHIKVIYSIGGWTWSGGFTQAAADPVAFAESCYQMVEDPRWADVFDGIDIDWEYPNACGLQCDASGFSSFKNVMQALRNRFGAGALLTAAITADGSNGGKIDAADYGGAAQYLDWYMPMSYDYFGAFSPQGPTAPHSPLTSYAGIPQAGFNTDAAVQKLKSKGVPASKILLGIGFYGRGWTGVTQAAPGGSATGAAPCSGAGCEAGIEDYKILKNSCPANGTVGGTAYCFLNGNWWGYDTPSTIAGKMNYKKQQGLGGTFFWELSGDTANGELISAIDAND